MDPANPMRGPRRALRRGEQALRYDRLSYPEAAEAGGGLGRRLARDRIAADEAAPYQNELLVMQRMREEVWENDEANDNEVHDDSDDGLVDETSSGEDAVVRGTHIRGHHLVDEDMTGDVEAGEGQDEEDEEEGEEDDDDDDDDDDEEEAEEEEGQDEDEDDLDVGEDGDDEGDFDFASQHDDLRGEDALMSFDPMLLGLKEINNLAHFSVSSHKPGNGVEELLNDDLDKYWQSDGPQPHLLTIHFLRRVEIRAIRFYVDYNQDESYTPVSVTFSAGTGHHDLLEFATLALNQPVGWQEINMSHVGGGADEQSLCCWIVQVKVKENHQNGKDTHIRGIKLYAIDENAPPADSALDELARLKMRTLQQVQSSLTERGETDAFLDREDYLFERLITQSADKLPGAPERSGSIATFLRDMEIR